MSVAERDRVVPTKTGVVGTSVSKRDALAKVDGSALYTSDLTLPGMLRARFLRSPYAHARITRIDTTAAESVSGVRAVLTHLNTPPTRYTDADSDMIDLLPNGPELDQVLFSERVRYAGEPVAAVAAEDPESLELALESIEVEYEVLPAVLDPEQAMRPEAPRIHDHATGNRAGELRFAVGDVDAGLADAAFVIRRTFRTSRQKHAQMEPTACIARWEGERVTVWSPTQAPHLVKQKLSRLFGLPQNAVRVINPHIGGAFGSLLGFSLEPHAVALSRASGRPVRLELRRDEMFPGLSSRHPMTIDLEVGFAHDGRPTAIRARLVSDTGAYITQGRSVTGATTEFLFRMYPCANVAFEGITVYTNTPVSGAFRGYGGPQVLFALEQVIDMAAERLGLDPVELRNRIAIRERDLDPVLRVPVTSCGLRECLQRGAAAIDWSRSRALSPKERTSGSKVRGVGMASVMWISGTATLVTPLEASTATLNMHEDGSVTVLSAASDMGTGSRTTLLQVVAEELGVPFDDVRIGPTDTDATPFDIAAHASRTLFVAGNACRVAAAALRRQLIDAAARELECDPMRLTIVDGRAQEIDDAARGVSVREVARAAYRRGEQFVATGRAPQVNASPYGAQFAEVEVDTATGVVRVLRLVAAHDVGRAINPVVVEGQIEGALQQGLGYALLEDMPIDPASGTAIAQTFADYRMPTTQWMPEIDVILVEKPSADGPFGAKGCGEMGLGPTAAAVANAITHAIGVRLVALPMTPERVLSALDSAP